MFTGQVKLPPNRIITPTITVSTDAYTANDCVGGKLTLKNAMRVGSGILQDLLITDKSGTQKPQLEIYIFDSDPTLAADGYTPSVLTDADTIALNEGADKLLARLDVYPSDYVLEKSGGVYTAHLKNLGVIVTALAGNNLYAAIKCVGTPDFVNADDLGMRFKFMRD
jgi:hypothetical protein